MLGKPSVASVDATALRPHLQAASSCRLSCQSSLHPRLPQSSLHFAQAAVTAHTTTPPPFPPFCTLPCESCTSHSPPLLQVLVYHDLLGMMQHPHYRKVTPKFAKQFASLGTVIHDALSHYKAEVASAAFPGDRFSPYKISDAEVETLLRELEKQGLNRAAQAVAQDRDAKLRAQQEEI